MMSFLIKLDKFVSLTAGSSACFRVRVFLWVCVRVCVCVPADLTCLQMAMCYISITVPSLCRDKLLLPLLLLLRLGAGMQLLLKSSPLNGPREGKMKTHFAFQWPDFSPRSCNFILIPLNHRGRGRMELKLKQYLWLVTYCESGLLKVTCHNVSGGEKKLNKHHCHPPRSWLSLPP